MAKKIGMGVMHEVGENLNPFELEMKDLKAEIEKLRKEKKKALEENKMLKKELADCRKEAKEQDDFLFQVELPE